MNAGRHPRAFLALALAVAAVWVTMATSAVSMVTPAAHCHGVPMPCCPPNDAGAAHCVSAQCIVELPQRAEAPNLPVAQVTEATLMAVPQLFPAPVRDLTRGVGWEPGVFRLKDDLRI
jgi:hypothetical protein